MKRTPTLFLFSLLSLATVPAQADIIDDAIGNIQQAINDAYKPDSGRDYEDSRVDGVAKVQNAGVFKQIVATLFVRRAVHRDGCPNAPAQRKQSLDVVHVIVGE